jgi:hypothetical protein
MGEEVSSTFWIAVAMVTIAVVAGRSDVVPSDNTVSNGGSRPAVCPDDGA